MLSSVSAGATNTKVFTFNLLGEGTINAILICEKRYTFPNNTFNLLGEGTINAILNYTVISAISISVFQSSW